MVTKTLKSAAMLGLASFLALSPLYSNSQEYAYLPKQKEYIPETKATPPSLKPKESKQNPNTNYPAILGIESPINLRYIPEEEKYEGFEKILNDSALKSNELFQKKFISDLEWRFPQNTTGRDWANERIQDKTLNILKNGFEETLKDTDTYKNLEYRFSENVERYIVDPVVKPLLTTLLGERKGERVAKDITVSFDPDLGIDRFDPTYFPEKREERIILSQKGLGLSLAEDNEINLRFGFGKANISYRKDVGRGLKFSIVEQIDGGIKWNNFSTDDANLSSNIVLSGNIGKGFEGYLRAYSVKAIGQTSQNESGLVLGINKIF